MISRRAAFTATAVALATALSIGIGLAHAATASTAPTEGASLPSVSVASPVPMAPPALRDEESTHGPDAVRAPGAQGDDDQSATDDDDSQEDSSVGSNGTWTQQGSGDDQAELGSDSSDD